MKTRLLSWDCAIVVSLKVLDGLRLLHDCGWLHRDIKPGNLIVGRGRQRSDIIIIDFGLARRFKTPMGEIRPPRTHPGFRGTPIFAGPSMMVSPALEANRGDDLWSALYVALDLAAHLPWRNV